MPFHPRVRLPSLSPWVWPSCMGGFATRAIFPAPLAGKAVKISGLRRICNHGWKILLYNTKISYLTLQ